MPTAFGAVDRNLKHLILGTTHLPHANIMEISYKYLPMDMYTY